MATKQNGIKKVVSPDEKNYIRAKDVQNLLGVSQTKAYQIIKALREELISSGNLISEYPSGKVPKKYFNRRCGFD